VRALCGTQICEKYIYLLLPCLFTVYKNGSCQIVIGMPKHRTNYSYKKLLKTQRRKLLQTFFQRKARRKNMSKGYCNWPKILPQNSKGAN
jgi:hypothetical protein